MKKTNNYADRFIKKSTIINTEKEQLAFASKKAEKAYNKEVLTKKEQFIKNAIAGCNETYSRQYKLDVIIKEAKKALKEEATKEDSRTSTVEMLNRVIKEAEEEKELFKRAEAEAEAMNKVNNMIYCKTLSDFRTLDEKEQNIILRKSVRYQIKKADSVGHIELDENGNAIEKDYRYYHLWVDRDGFNSGMEVATNETFLQLCHNCKRYQTERRTEYKLKKKSTFKGYGNGTTIAVYETITKESYHDRINAIVAERNADIEAEEKQTGRKHDRLTAFRILLGMSARQALFNVNYNEYKHVKYMDRANRIDTTAYETTACDEWQTAEKAIQNEYFNSIAQTPNEKKIINAVKAGYTTNEIAEIMDMSTRTVERNINRMKYRVNCDRMQIALERIASIEMNYNKNANDNYILRCWIMAGIKAGMTHKKIAEYLHIEPKTDKKGNVTQTPEQQLQKLLGKAEQFDVTVKLNPQTLPNVPFNGVYHKQTEKPYYKRFHNYKNTEPLNAYQIAQATKEALHDQTGNRQLITEYRLNKIHTFIGYGNGTRIVRYRTITARPDKADIDITKRTRTA